MALFWRIIVSKIVLIFTWKGLPWLAGNVCRLSNLQESNRRRLSSSVERSSPFRFHGRMPLYGFLSFHLLPQWLCTRHWYISSHRGWWCHRFCQSGGLSVLLCELSCHLQGLFRLCMTRNGRCLPQQRSLAHPWSDWHAAYRHVRRLCLPILHGWMNQLAMSRSVHRHSHSRVWSQNRTAYSCLSTDRWHLCSSFLSWCTYEWSHIVQVLVEPWSKVNKNIR